MTNLETIKFHLRELTIAIGRMENKNTPIFTLLTNEKGINSSNGGDDMPYLKEGSIRKKIRGNSHIWEARYYDETKKLKSVYNKNQAECIKKLKKALTDRDKRVKEGKKQLHVTLIDWVLKWLEIYRKPHITAKRYKDFIAMVERHVPIDLKNKKLLEVKTEELQLAIDNITPLGSGTPNPTRTKSEIYNLIANAFEMAYNTQLIPHNPMLAVVKPVHRKNHGKPLTLNEQEQFLINIQTSEMHYLFQFYLYTGTRRTEALKIKWTDVDFDNKILHIPGTKTANADRLFPLHPQLINLLNKIPRENAVIFPYCPDTVGREFKRLCPTHHLHDLRHTFVTRCAENGMNTKAIASIVGHANDNITKNLYFTALSEFVTTESEKLGDIFKN